MRRSLRTVVALVAVGGVLVGCGTADDTESAALDDGSAAVELGSSPEDTSGLTDDPAGDDDSGTPTTSDDAADDATDAAADDAPADAGADADAAAGGDIDPATQHPVAADPGRWAAGDAGYVEWDLTDGGLQLVEVTEADGWSSRVVDEDSDEIEVDFRQGNTDIEFEVERKGSGVEVEIQTDIEPADAGVYELGQAGSFEFSVDGGLSLQDVVVADGWELRIDDESSDEIEFTVTSGNERWKVDIDYDDGELELQIDYRVQTSR